MIWDCFPFFNELDLLELRLETLKGHVDRHVLVESVTTHSGRPKPLYFDENRERFKSYPITHVAIYQPPEVPDEWAAKRHPDHPMAWTRENHQRDAILTGLQEAAPGDVILLSDLDEIPRPERIPEAVAALRSGKHQTVIFWLRFYYYFMDMQAKDETWFLATRATIKKNLVSPMHLRWEMNGDVIKDAGWHFSWLGGKDEILNKLHSFAHRELDRPEITDGDFIETCLRLHRTVHSMKPLTLVPFDGSYPELIRAQPERFRKYFYQAIP